MLANNLQLSLPGLSGRQRTRAFISGNKDLVCHHLMPQDLMIRLLAAVNLLDHHAGAATGHQLTAPVITCWAAATPTVEQREPDRQPHTPRGVPLIEGGNEATEETAEMDRKRAAIALAAP
jgi:hypothetical protein